MSGDESLICGEVDPDTGKCCTLPWDHLARDPEGFHAAGWDPERQMHRTHWRKVKPLYRLGGRNPYGFRVNDRVKWTSGVESVSATQIHALGAKEPSTYQMQTAHPNAVARVCSSPTCPAVGDCATTAERCSTCGKATTVAGVIVTPCDYAVRTEASVAYDISGDKPRRITDPATLDAIAQAQARRVGFSGTVDAQAHADWTATVRSARPGANVDGAVAEFERPLPAHVSVRIERIPCDAPEVDDGSADICLTPEELDAVIHPVLTPLVAKLRAARGQR